MLKRSREEREAEMVARRDSAVLEAAIALAEGGGLAAVTRDGVAARAGVSMGTVNNAFGTITLLRDEVMRQAVARGIPVIIAQGLAAGSEIARNAPPGLKDRALATLTT